jgi:hypothetical protein
MGLEWLGLPNEFLVGMEAVTSYGIMIYKGWIPLGPNDLEAFGVGCGVV